MSTDAGTRAEAARTGAGWLRLADRGLLEVSGGDRERWLDGMVSNDVRSLDPGEPGARAHCHALLLTPQGRILGDLHVIARPEAYWLETEAGALDAVRERLEKYVIADDVVLRDASAQTARFAVEGPAAARVLAALGAPDDALRPDAAGTLTIGGASVVWSGYGWSGFPAFQLFAPPAAAGAVEEALRGIESLGALVALDAAGLELLRIEAGIPRFGAELDDSVLPGEARLDDAVSTTKGCYTGQEVVARMRSRGRVGHLLVGLHLEDGALPESGEPIVAAPAGGPEKKVGEVTSAARSPVAGAIVLGFVRSRHAEPGTRLRVGDRDATVHALPLAPRPAAAAAGADGGDRA